jgi:PleD family two-component response regulator
MVHAEEKWKSLVVSKVEKIRSELANPKDGLPGFTVSCGIAHGSHAEDTATLVRMADEALYQTKKNGRDGYTFSES